ncbi:2OG-Fe(II) oxygenase [Dyella flava]
MYKIGHFISPHRDSGSAYPDRLFSVVTYLNSDYSGGEIVFPSLNRSYHPECGTSLIFPCETVHEVRPVLSGMKQIFLFFLNRQPRPRPLLG